MRFQSGFAARAERVAMETRAIERPSGVQQVLAPAGWSDVRIEAWLDWVEAEGFATPLSGDWLNGGVDAWITVCAYSAESQLRLPYTTGPPCSAPNGIAVLCHP